MKQKISAEVKVGIFVLTAFVLLAYMTTRITRGTSITGDTYTVYAVFENVSGLKANSPVEIAGINIGTIKSIGLDNNQARVKMAVDQGVQIYQDAAVSIRTRGVLGDKFVEINPGSPQTGPVQDQDTITRTIQPTDIDQIMARVGDIAQDLSVLSSSVSQVFGGPEGEAGMREAFTNLRQASVHLNELIQANTRGINLIVDNMEQFSSDLVSMSQANRQGISNIVSNFETASRELNTTLKQVNSILATAETGKGPVATLLKDQEMSSSMKETVASLESVSKKLDEGKGTLGRLISDDQTGQKLDQALDSMNDFLARYDRFQTVVDFHTEFMSSGDTKSYLDLTLQPSEDKYYLLSLVDDPKGRTRTTDTITRTSTGGGPWQTTREIQDKTYKNRLKFSAQLAKGWEDLVLRGGIIESSGGAGLDYFLWDDRVKLSLEAFDLGSDDRPHLKARANLYFWKNFYLTAGYDDFISSHDQDRSLFGGLGFFFTDEDLKYLLSSVPTGGIN